MLTSTSNTTTTFQTTPAVPIGMKKAQESVAGTMGENPGAPGPLAAIKTTTTETTTTESTPPKLGKLKRKLPIKYIVAGILLILLLVGAGAAFYLSQIQQDIRQQAAGDAYDQTCVDACLKTASGDLTYCRNQCPAEDTSGQCPPGFAVSGNSCVGNLPRGWSITQ